MTVGELKNELGLYEDNDLVEFLFNGNVKCSSWTEDVYGNKTVFVDSFLKPTFMCSVGGNLQITLEV